MERITVYLVNDNWFLRESVKRLFDSTDDIRMSGTAATVEAALEELPRTRPDVVMLQCHACGGGRHCSVQKLKEQGPQLRLLLFAMPEDEQEFIASIRCGATGYLLKDASAEDLLDAVRALHRNEAVVPRSLSLALVELAGGFRPYPAQADLRAQGGLTDRERQLVPLMTAGFSNKQIAGRLGIAEQTVKNHVRHILGKLKLKHRSEIAADLAAADPFVDPMTVLVHTPSEPVGGRGAYPEAR